ncbi:MAG: succinate dehydrogenase cytochrome b subunit [Deltaproteobacteria bacterium]|nr:succinate dehydrogenase cytochrome b subunit [Deltaproteobacteria bacterium]
MQTFMNSVVRKTLMSLTGIVMLWFTTVHLLGNTMIFHGPDDINAYSAGLHYLPTLLWTVRIVLIGALAVHVFLGVMLTLENWRTKPHRYAVKRMLKATFAGETMIWTGLLTLFFLVFHLLHFSFRVVPGAAPAPDFQGRFDIFTMVRDAFRSRAMTLGYLAAMVVLSLHLSHGVQSILQTIGLNNEKSMPWVRAFGNASAVFFLVGYGIIPVLVIAGIGVFTG